MKSPALVAGFLWSWIDVLKLSTSSEIIKVETAPATTAAESFESLHPHQEIYQI